MVQCEPSLVALDGRQVTMRLPATCIESSPRSVRRHTVTGIAVSVVANSAVYTGQLIDFSAQAFRIELCAEEPQTFDWIDASNMVGVTMMSGAEVVYAGECRIIRQSQGHDRREYVLQPVRVQTPRFRPREFRSTRSELMPAPNTIFSHPLTLRTMNLKVIDLSGTGFALAEPSVEATLIPGLIIRQITIVLATRTLVECTAQVVHRTPVGESGLVKVGLALLDIDTLDHMELVSLLQQSKDPDVYVSTRVDMDALWAFFFETGFLSPEKYALLAENKTQFQETFARIYSEHPTIARHFIHMEHGRILGHFAMLRLFEKTWVNHHHAALHHKRKSGLLVLQRMSEYINDTHTLHSAHFRYNAGYYRTDNKFPVRFFGGFAEHVNNPEACSVDEFSFIAFRGQAAAINGDGNDGWELTEASREDLVDLQGFYREVSGGLMLEAIDMTPESAARDTLTAEYARAGLKREAHRLAIRRYGELKAVVSVNLMDAVLNFSELANATQLFVVDGAGFTRRDFTMMMSRVAARFALERIPLLVYPCTFLEEIGIPFEKNYVFNVMSMRYWDDYMRYLHEFLRKAKVS
jgi:hypothetical protein